MFWGICSAVFYDITEKGNFEEGKSIPHMPLTLEAFAQREGMDPAKLDTALKDDQGTAL